MIGLLGISYKTTSLDIREKYAFTNEEIIQFAEFLQHETDIADLVILSTCNRTEIYFSQDIYDKQTAYDLLFMAMNKFKAIDEYYWHAFYHKSNTDAVRHLYEVASGLDSMVLGEDQIIGQIKEAYIFCTQAALTDDVLMRLFQKSFEAGKRVRTETAIKLGTTSISAASVDLCVRQLGDLSEKSLLIVGAGETGSLALQNFQTKGIGQTTVINRTQEKAEALAKQYDASSAQMATLMDEVAKHDIIVVATASQNHLITKQMIESIAINTAKEMQVFVDLSVPRNIDETISEFQKIRLYSVDDLEEVVRVTTEKRLECIDSASKIIDEVVSEFNEWLASRSLRPAIKTITTNLQTIHNRELSLNKKYDSPEIQTAVEEYAVQLTQRYTGLLIKNLKALTNNGKEVDSLNIIDDLFKLD
ncbi:MAG: glutamyl-tRNA reductase [Bacteroidales bacterium]|nr:glutamyl-tRNA reductase [Bacteroidales bacterium]